MARGTIARRLLGVPWPPLVAVGLFIILLVSIFAQRLIERPQARSNGPLTIVVAGDTRGAIAPVCSANPTGGLARRGELIRRARAAGPVVVADLGNAAFGDSAYDRANFSAILKGEALLGVAAHNVGPSEAALGAAELRELGRRSGVLFVSTNVRDATGRPVAETLRVVESGGRRVAIAGLLSPSYGGESLRIESPRQALDGALQPHVEYDDLLVLAYLTQEETKELLSHLPGQALVVTPADVEASVEGDSAAIVLTASVGQQGTSVVRFDRDPADGWSGQSIAVDSNVPEEPRQIDNLVEYHRELARRDFAAQETRFVLELPPAVGRETQVAGTHTCRACHIQDCAAWDNSPHARAWQTLVDRGVQYDVACQRCHTTGFGWAGGFVSADRSHATLNVGCESCHGPSFAHVLDPMTRTPLVARDQCGRCHTAETSGEFNFDAAWGAIRHGPSAEALVPTTDRATSVPLPDSRPVN
jgi:hypothetical protein